MEDSELGTQTEFEVVRMKNGSKETLTVAVATEVPCTIDINGAEAATLMCTPSHLKEFAVGFLFTSGMIQRADDVQSFFYDPIKWKIDIQTKRDVDFDLLGKRLYTSGCGKGVMYSGVIELASRHPIESNFTVTNEFLNQCMKWLVTCSPLYRETSGVHTVAISLGGTLPQFYIDDIGRHNAVDKVIGHCLLENLDFSESVLLCTGRISSEILHKIKRCGIPIILSRGVPTHQTVMMAADMGICVVGFARGGNFTIYTQDHRVLFDNSAS
jgi:FdhD protein